MFPWLFSYVPKKTLEKYQGFISPLFDIIQNLVVFGITYHLTQNLETSLIAQVIYATMPIAILENSYLTPRSLGYLNFTLAFYPILYYSNFHDIRFLFVGFGFTILLFLTHRFALQSLLFVGLFFSVIEKTLIYPLIFFASMFIAILLSRGYYLRVLKGHLSITHFWIINYRYRFAHQIRGIVANKKSDFLGLIYYLLSTFTPISLVATNLWLIIPLGYMLNQWLLLFPLPLIDPFIFKMSLWVLFCYILAVLVLSVKYLIPIGEGQRYLEMALAPTAVVTTTLFQVLISNDHKYLAYLLFFSILTFNITLTVYSQLKGVIQDKTRSVRDTTKQVFNFLNNIRPIPRIMCIPHYNAAMYAYNTKTKVLMDIEVCKINETSFLSPILRRKVSDIASEYNLDYLVLNKRYATKDELKLSKNKVVFATDDIEVINIRQR